MAIFRTDADTHFSVHTAKELHRPSEEEKRFQRGGFLNPYVIFQFSAGGENRTKPYKGHSYHPTWNEPVLL